VKTITKQEIAEIRADLDEAHAILSQLHDDTLEQGDYVVLERVVSSATKLTIALEAVKKQAEETKAQLDLAMGLLARYENVSRAAVVAAEVPTSDRDHWKARAEALEDAIRTVYGHPSACYQAACSACVNYGYRDAIACDGCNDNSLWQFDQERFTVKKRGRVPMSRLIDAEILKECLPSADLAFSNHALEVARKFIDEQSTAPQWIKINGPEDLPPMQVRVLVRWRTLTCSRIEIGYISAQGNWTKDCTMPFEPNSVTHWMLLPAPPNGEQQ